jgi:transcriptional antiterminator Rof (Rho-off)
VASGDLLELLIGNQVMGAIPLADLKAEELIRGDKIDVYDYLQAALQHLVERVALMWLRGEVAEHKEEQAKRREEEQALLRDEQATQELRKPKQEVGGSARRFATVRIDGQEY